MARFNIDFSQFRPSSQVDTPKKSVFKRLQTSLNRLTNPIRVFAPPSTPLMQVRQPSQLPVKPSFKQKVSSFFAKPTVQKFTAVLNKPSEVAERLLTGGRGYEAALEDPKFRSRAAAFLSIPQLGTTKKAIERSFETEKGRKVSSFVGRMVIDPLNLIPVGKIAGLLGKGSKALRGTAKIGSFIEKAADFTKPLRANLGKKFIRGFQLPETFNVLKNEIPTKLAIGGKKIVENLGDVFSKYGDLSDEARDAVGKFLEPKGAGIGTNLGALKATLKESGQWGVVSGMLTDSRKLLDNEVLELVKRGRMKGSAAKDLLTRGGYFPHTEFAPKGIKKYFSGAREVAERRWYLKKRKGTEGFTFNAPRAIAKRELAQFQDDIIQDWLIQVKTGFGYKVSKGNPVKEGFHYFETPPKGLFELKGYALPARIAEDLLSTNGVTNVLTRIIDKFNSLWKPTATAWNPAFHNMNVMGNSFNSWIGGMKDPKRFLQSIVGGFDEGEKAILEGSGILARGQFGADLVNKAFTDIDAKNLLRMFDSPIAKNLKKFSPRQIGNFFENNARSAFFLNSREKFLVQGLGDLAATRKAVAETNKYLFDYLTGLAPFETNIMRRIFPFYTWARFNIPLQFQQLIYQPQKYAAVTKIYEELNKGHTIPDDEEGLGIPTPFVDESGTAIRWVPNLPIGDIFGLGRRRFANMANPLIKDGIPIAAWLAFGTTPQDVFTGRPRTDTRLPFGEQVKDVATSTVQSLIRPVRSVGQFQDPGRSTESILDFIIGGFYVNNEEKRQLRELYETQGLNSALRYKIRNVSNDPKKTIEVKREEVNRLIKLME